LGITSVISSYLKSVGVIFRKKVKKIKKENNQKKKGALIDVDIWEMSIG
jgi:hypothetical protein